MLDATGHDIEVSRAELDVAVAELDRQPALDDEEEVVGLGMGVPDELALRLRDLKLVVVQIPDDPRAERPVEGRELLRRG